ncbi:MAG: formate dehydrogenase accessory sulfurtransferase FdhD [Dongiaceae bacterium]
MRVRNGQETALPQVVAAEVPIALSYNGRSHVVMMGTPSDLEDFAVGFSLAEGIVDDVDEIEDIACSDSGKGMRVSVAIPPAWAARIENQQRNLAGRTGCGLCGVTTIEQALRPLPTIPPGPSIAASAIAAALDDLPRHQSINRETGAVHAAAFADRDGTLLVVREDVGRHNALDKLTGALARAGIDPSDGFAIVTSRCSMEMVQKAATVGFPLLVAISAPTSLAIELAEGCGLTLVAFARGGGFNIYAHGERLSVDR